MRLKLWWHWSAKKQGDTEEKIAALKVSMAELKKKK